MKTPMKLAIAVGLMIGGLNVSGQTLSPIQTADKEVAEMKTYVVAITPDEERQLLKVEQDYATGKQTADNTISDEDVMKTQQKQLWNDRDTKIKAILDADQFKQYMKVEKVVKYNCRNHRDSRWPRAYFV